MNRPLLPKWLKNLDKKMLLNNPNLWSTRFHLVLFYSILFIAAISVLYFLTFSDVRSFSNIPTWIGLTGTLSFIGLVIWLIYLLRFNVFKRHGNLHKTSFFVTFCVLFICISFLVIPAYFPPIIESAKANYKYTSDEIIDDVNEINKVICTLEFSKFPVAWIKDTVYIDNSLTSQIGKANPSKAYKDEDGNWITVEDSYMDTASLRDKIAYSDSVVKVDDKTYVFFESPHYALVSDKTASSYSSKKSLTNKGLYYSVIKNYESPKNAKLLETKLMKLLDKYRQKKSRYLYNDDYYAGDELSYDAEIIKKYKLSSVNNGIENICQKKYRWVNGDLPIYFRVYFYITLALTTLLFIFRHCTIKTFFLTLLVAALLAIFTGIVLAISQSEAIGIIITVLFYYIIFGIITISIGGDLKRTAFKGIALNIFTFFIPYLPLVIVALLYEIERKKYESDIITTYPNNRYNFYASYEKYFVVAEFVGVAIFLILLHFLFRKLYRKWYSLPED